MSSREVDGTAIGLHRSVRAGVRSTVPGERGSPGAPTTSRLARHSRSALSADPYTRRATSMIVSPDPTIVNGARASRTPGARATAGGDGDGDRPAGPSRFEATRIADGGSRSVGRAAPSPILAPPVRGIASTRTARPRSFGGIGAVADERY